MNRLSAGRSPRRRLGVGLLVAVAGVLALMSAAWACLAESYTSSAVTPNRMPAASTATVSGSGWAATSDVALSLSTDGANVLSPLGTVTSGRDGGFVQRVRVGQVEPGVYYVVASQGDLRRVSPLEITGSSQPARVAFGAAGSSPDFAVRPDAPGAGGSGFPIAGVAFFGALTLALGGWGLFEVRRKRATPSS